MIDAAYEYMSLLQEETIVEVEIASIGDVCQFQCDTDSRENIIGINTAISIGLSVPNPRPWTPKGAQTPVMVTHEEFAAIGQAILNKKDELYQIYFAHKTAINALSGYWDVITYDYTTGYN